MSMAKMKQKIDEAESALKARLVELYNKLMDGKLSDEEKKRLEVAIAEVKALLGPQTKRLIGGDQTPAQAAH